MSPKVRDSVIAISFLLAAAAFSYSQLTARRESQSIDAQALGREFAPKLAAGLAEGFDAGAEVLESADGTIAAGIEKQKAVFLASREKAFERLVGPAFALIVPEGKEPDSRSTRIELARAWREFAKGLRRTR